MTWISTIISMPVSPPPPFYLGVIAQTEHKATVKNLGHFAEVFPEMIGANPVFS